MVIGGCVRKGKNLQGLRADDVPGNSGMGHLRLKITGTLGTQPLFGCKKRFALGFNGEIWNYKSLRKELELCGHIFEVDSDSEVIVHLIEENYRESGSFSESVIRTMNVLDGEWAFAVIDTARKKAILARDPVGIKQLYYGSDTKYISFSSEKKPLFKLGLKPHRVMPGNIVEVNFDTDYVENDFKTHDAVELSQTDVGIFNEGTALGMYKKALFEAVEKRIADQSHVGIIFSGGVDSVLIAHLLGVNITCYASGASNSSDLLAARRVAGDLGFKLRESLITEEKIAANLENIISAIESTDHLQVDVAIPIYFAVELAKEDGIRVMLTGQGADELFAGYPWYREILEKNGHEMLNQSLWNDIKHLYKDTLEREDKITMFHSVELRVPFLDPTVIKSAMSISEDLKIKDGWGKHIHRKFAEITGVPKYAAWRQKEAAQHGSDSHKKLDSVLRQKQFLVKSDLPLIEHEKLGSAYRYNHDVYQHNKDIQLVLNHIGFKLGLEPLTQL